MTVGPVSLLPVAGQAPGTKSAPGTGFGQTLNNALGSLDAAQKKADNAVENFLTGRGQDLSQVTVAMEEAKVEMELGVEVRNKIVDAYNQIWQMPV